VGNQGTSRPSCGWDISNGTPQDEARAEAALQARAYAAGFPPKDEACNPRPASATNDDVAAWIGSLPFRTRYQTVRGILDGLDPPVTVDLRLTYTKVHGPGEERSAATNGDNYHHHPVQLIETGGVVSFNYNDSYVAALMDIKVWGLDNYAVLHINQLGQLPAPAPPGLELASGVFEFINLGYGSFTIAPDLRFGLHANPAAAQVYWYDPVLMTWAAPPGLVIINPPNRVVTIQTTQMGIYAAFAPPSAIPTVSEWGLYALILLLVLVPAVWMIKRRVRAQIGTREAGCE